LNDKLNDLLRRREELEDAWFGQAD